MLGTETTTDALAESALTFWRDGYVVLRNVFTPEEMSLLRQAIDGSAAMQERVREIRKKREAGSYPSFDTIFV